ncbi:cysteine desulfurase [Labedella gwakjiensis]|uniref:cysteine desulfurase n=1 Tax=Labedella gwakjiensis TaxID=390269 RepID=A0A2P8H169_9MICO|nr:cysteine desulfurase family protein [Labedella gwakjiensis]PSL39940.1 cysteine desulfurase [Labedella gwakjiensis]RUQ85699.1 cysteine desulfurase [Labedella gwakjiensis]
MIYLDAAATAPVRREVLQAMWPYLTTEFGNPSSVHAVGEAAATALEDARRRVARAFEVRATNVVFTAGGTEADNLAVKGLALATPRGRHLIVSAIEHEAVLRSADYLARLHGFEVSIAPVDHDGRVDPEAVASLLRPDTTLVSVMHANNEVGTVQPVWEIAERAHAVGALVHTDAVQSVGQLDTRIGELGVDALTFSGHKLGAPKGTGALVLGGRHEIEPLVHGGGQERGRRSGTESVAGAVALATALEFAEAEQTSAVSAAVERDAFVSAVRSAVPTAVLTGHTTERLPRNASFVFPGVNGETILLELERRGVLSSSGSACAAGRTETSHVLLAMGLADDVARSAVRFTWVHGTTPAELAGVAESVAHSVAALRSIRS